MRSKPLFALVAGAFLFGCTTFTGPGWILAHSDYLGVEVRSATPPYRVISHAGVRAPQTPDRREWTFDRLASSTVVIDRACFAQSCWTIAAVPAVADAAGYQLSDDCNSGLGDSLVCRGRSWRSALCEATEASEYLLDGAPLPLEVVIYLIDGNDTIEDAVIGESETSVPLTFVFQYPAYDDNSEYSAQRRGDALIRIMSKIWHEVQHVNSFASASHFKAAHKEVGLIAENEANSVCWEYSIEAIMAYSVGSPMDITKSNDKHLAGMREVFGPIQRTNASAVVPMLVENKLVDFLTNVDASARVGDSLRIDPDDTRLLDHLLTFCRAYSPDFTGDTLRPLIWSKTRSDRMFDSVSVTARCEN